MMRRMASILCLLVLFTVAKPCGPFVPTFNLVVMRMPDGDRADWAAGRLGLLQPMLPTADLVVAWRWLTGVGLNAEERLAILPAGGTPQVGGGEAWKRAVAAAGAPVEEPKLSRVGAQYQEQPVVGDHALGLAARTLEEHLKRYGKGSAPVQSWLAAQQQVFTWTVPAAAESSLPLRIRQDRAYQVAAAQFYQEDYLAALASFEKVAADSANPWRGWAKYVMARIFAKAGSIAGSEMDAEQALALLAQIQSDPALAEIQPDAAALENRIRYLADAPEFYARLIRNLAAKGRGAALVQDMEDLRWLRVLEPWTEGLKGVEPAGVHAWIDLIQKKDAEAAIGAYDAAPDLPHLVAVMLSLRPDHPRVEAFLKLAQQASLRPGPAYATLVSHRLRILCAQKRMKAAEALATEALAQPSAAKWPSAFNLWSQVKLAQAADLNAFAAHLGRRLASVDDGEWSPWSEHPDEDPKDRRFLKALDPAAISLLNRRMPLRLWEGVLDASAFPHDLKAEWLEALWTRAAILGREDVMARRAPELAKARPAMAKDLAAWSGETDAARKKGLAFLLIWEHRLWPQLISYREEAFQYGTLYARWQGPPEAGKEAEPARGVDGEPPPRGLNGYVLALSPAFLDGAADREGLGEAARVPAPLTWFCEQALALALARPKDPLTPGALSRAVRASRNANRDARSAGLVLKAFRLLHKDYEGTEAAKEARVYH
ncbi:MAG: hypothetical protein HY014_00485 [Acidobacteria bacterium]|nr:hypothetical protein [Acidobacteriota bacterium]MBI3486629.1 hypothetical protein [Acidobacteriota bacterium]